MEEKNFETKIILDEKKLEENHYSKEIIYDYLEKVFASVDMVRNNETFEQGTCAMTGVALNGLFKVEWFMKLVKEWTLSIRENGVITYTEDIFSSKAVREKYLRKYGLLEEEN